MQEQPVYTYAAEESDPTYMNFSQCIVTIY